MTALPKDQVREMLPQVTLGSGMSRLTQELFQHLSDDGTATAATLHEALFPAATLSSANTQLNRLISKFNEAAEEQHSTLRLEITRNKKAGAAARRIWFEGQYAPPNPLNTPEYDRIPADQRLDLQARHLRPVVLLVTFNDNETRAVYEVFDYKPTQVAIGEHVPVTSLGEHGMWDVIHVVSNQGNQAARTTIERAIKEVKPSLVLACGIAFGVNSDDQKIGDVLCATAIVGYELSKVRGTKIQRKGDSPPISEDLRARYQSVKTYFDHQPVGQMPPVRIHLGKLLSGEKLIDRQDYRDELVRYYHHDVIGGEMEGIGVHAAAQEMNNCSWGVIKAICDFADGNKNNPDKEAHQRLAAHQAALVTRKLLETFIPADIKERRPTRLLPPYPNAADLSNLGIEIPDMQAVSASMRKHLAELQEAGGLLQEQAFSINEHLITWANAERSAPCFALLGEYGMGKTIAAQRLATDLYEQHRRNGANRVPLLFDFRDYSGLSEGVPTLDDILMRGSQLSWKARPNGEPYTRQMIYDWIDKGAVLIFDGLDEALVKMSAADGQIFTRTLLKAFNDHYTEWRDHRDQHPDRPDPKHIPKILLTCRTQYFRTL